MNNPLTSRSAATLIRIEMLRRGITHADLAHQVGVKSGHLSNVICGNQSSAVTRRKIEKCLGASFWPAEETSSTRRQPQSV